MDRVTEFCLARCAGHEECEVLHDAIDEVAGKLARLEELENASRAFLGRVVEIEQSDRMISLYVLSANRGMPWPEGYNWVAERDALRRVLGEVKP